MPIVVVFPYHIIPCATPPLHKGRNRGGGGGKCPPPLLVSFTCNNYTKSQWQFPVIVEILFNSNDTFESNY